MSLVSPGRLMLGLYNDAQRIFGFLPYSCQQDIFAPQQSFAEGITDIHFQVRSEPSIVALIFESGKK